jgi:hypothetical protein
MGREHGLPDHTGWYAERMWIPLALLRVAAVREAARRRVGFDLARTFDRSAWLARGLAALGHRAPPPWLHRYRAGAANARTGADRPPAFVEHDTGARLHADLLAHGWRFAAQPEDRWGGVHHFHGVTRATRQRRLRRLLAGWGLTSLRYRAPASPVLDEARRRLREGYGIEAGDPDAPVTPAPLP